VSAAKLDAIDKKILKHLQDNGRITNVELADMVGITAPPCLRRVRALEEAGFIKGYHADLNKERLGFGIVVFVMVGLDSQADGDLQAFNNLVGQWPLVREAFMINGEYDYVLKIVARDLAEFQEFLTNQLIPADRVGIVKTSLTIKNVKNMPGIPIET
jgi:DNA-binding Lrp family transcriptional regulator